MAKLFKLSFITVTMVFMAVIRPATAYPLSTRSRWIVDEEGRRVKLACVNWPAHLQAAVAEGLSKQAVEVISESIKKMGFNCVRLTWPLDLMTNDTLARNVTVRQSFQSLNLSKAIHGFQRFNPTFLDLSLLDAFKGVVEKIGKQGVMVILDNHLTSPGWCCGRDDNDAFFGDSNFDPAVWLAGLSKMAALFKDVSAVVGFSLRNELRGPHQDLDVWYKYMGEGAEAVHAANPNALVIVSGLDFDTNLSFLKDRPLNVNFNGKLVHELHWYSFSDAGGAWTNNNLNDICGQIVSKVTNSGGFLLQKEIPLFVSEFGTDQRGVDVDGNRYMNCFLGWAAENDVEWAYWALTGDYYLRQGEEGMIEYYGVLDANWKDVRNSTFLQKLAGIQPPLTGPSSIAVNHSLIFHPSTGLCIKTTDSSTLGLGQCRESDPWTFTPEGFLQININGTISCLQGSDKAGEEVKVGDKCSKLQLISNSRMHLSYNKTTGEEAKLCLDVGAQNDIVSSDCKCLSQDKSCDPSSQWFKIL